MAQQHGHHDKNNNMSQRQVNLKSRDFSADAVRSVQQATQTGLATVARFQAEAKKRKAA